MRLLHGFLAASCLLSPQFSQLPVVMAGQATPLRAAFYYPWYPEAWSQQGLDPFTRYHPISGLYSSSLTSVVGSQIAAMQYAGIAAGLTSWWGPGSPTDGRFPTLLSTARSTGFKWAALYEAEGKGNWDAARVAGSLKYIHDRYASDAAYLRLQQRFVIFVYADQHNGCQFAQNWVAARSLGAYVVMKVFSGYRSCPYQPDSWYQYAPAHDTTEVAGNSFMISPGFYKASESQPRLPRDLARWSADVNRMVSSGEPLQLITTFNEWGEGTAIEDAVEWASTSGYGHYLDVLHADRPPTPPAPAPPNSPTPMPIAVLASLVFVASAVGYAAWRRLRQRRA